MILAMDVGNTNIMLGVYEREELRFHWRLATDREKTEDEYGMLIRNLFEHAGLSLEQLEGVVISSVVPPLVDVLHRLSEKYFHIQPMMVGPGIKTGLNIKTENPREVGADRIVNAVAGIRLYGTPLILVDFGTATTFDYIDEQKQLLGCSIAPGIHISMEALYSRAAKLPRVELMKPESTVGKNTISAMQSGIVYGFIGQVEGIVGRMKKEFGKSTVVATGGLATLIASEVEAVDHVDPLLTLKGLRYIYEKNQITQKRM